MVLYKDMFDCAGHVLKEKMSVYVVQPKISLLQTAVGLALTGLAIYVLYKDLDKPQEISEKPSKPAYRGKPI